MCFANHWGIYQPNQTDDLPFELWGHWKTMDQIKNFFINRGLSPIEYHRPDKCLIYTVNYTLNYTLMYNVNVMKNTWMGTRG